MMFLDLVFPASAWAASSGGAEGHSASIYQLIFPIINFAIFLYILKRFLLPPVKNHLRSRRQEILTAITAAAEAKERAEAVLRDYRDRLAHLDEETKKIGETLRAEGEQTKSKILRETEELALKIRADADFLAQQEVKVAGQQVREEIARIAHAAAEKALRTDFKATDQERLVDRFLAGIGEAR
jgi:F-type H+-transporting ATPase subunit b